MENNLFEFEVEGLRCLVIKQPWLGHYCGYVEIPPRHRLYAVGSNDEKFNGLDVHGGITFSDDVRELSCELDYDGWWIGFDCAHAGDYIPGLVSTQNGHEWTFDEIKAEIIKLARQILEYR